MVVSLMIIQTAAGVRDTDMSELVSTCNHAIGLVLPGKSARLVALISHGTADKLCTSRKGRHSVDVDAVSATHRFRVTAITQSLVRNARRRPVRRPDIAPGA